MIIPGSSTFFQEVQVDGGGLNAVQSKGMQAATASAQIQPTGIDLSDSRTASDKQETHNFSQLGLISRILDIAFFPAASHSRFVPSHEQDWQQLANQWHFTGMAALSGYGSTCLSGPKFDFVLISLDLVERGQFGPFISEPLQKMEWLTIPLCHSGVFGETG